MLAPQASRFALALAFALAVAAPGRAADPAAPPRPAAVAQPAAPGVLWWNDPKLVEKLSLGAEQRGKMDALWKTYDESARANAIGKPRASYYGALHQAKYDEARKQSEAWAAAASALVRADGALKVGVFSLLSAEQRKQLDAMNPHLASFVWMPRPTWVPQPGASAKGRAPGAPGVPPAGAARPPAAP
jgi:Spy/CpxP family protein refolding chaperone